MVVDSDTWEPLQSVGYHRLVLRRLTSRGIGSLVYTNEAVAELEHIISEVPMSLGNSSAATDSPQGDNDELSVLRSVLDIVRHNGNVTEVEGSVNLVHKV